MFVPQLMHTRIAEALAALAVLTAIVSPMNAQAESKTAAKTELATLGGGCFWCLDALYRKFEGVVNVTSGYAGGTAPNPNYKQVCTGTTGHAEVVQIEYDPAKINYYQILEIFWEIHDP